MPLDTLAFDHRLARALPGEVDDAPPVPRPVQGVAWSPARPTPVPAPRLLAHSAELAVQLGVDADALADPRFTEAMAGNRVLPGMRPIATNYGGHQFGHWAGQLGDGRAILLGDVEDVHGVRQELQLKGAGLTPYSRTADGRAVLRSSIREFLCSEAMHHLGVPTTRALTLVATGEDVVRDMLYDGHPAPEPGAIVCRVAPSFLRFGHFELPASRGDLPLLQRLVAYAIATDPDCGVDPQAPVDATAIARWFASIATRTARLMCEWMRVGFVHGVMNTDNMSVLGLTIDYGPYGWIDDFDPDWTPNTTDRAHRRYRFGQQPQVAYWNLSRLAGALSPLFGGAHAPLQDGLRAYVADYQTAERAMFAAKLGLAEGDEASDALMRDLHGLLQASRADMTRWFRALAGVDASAPDLAGFAGAHYEAEARDTQRDALQRWLDAWATRVRGDARDPGERRAAMQRTNPHYVLRNYLAQLAIDRATAGDPTGITELLDVMRRPYDAQPGREAFAALRPDWAMHTVGCSMLSCSS